MHRGIVALLFAVVGWPQTPAGTYPAQAEGDFTLRDFSFKSGESLPTLRLHYLTIGTPKRNAAGQVDNAVLILHGTGGSGRSFTSEAFGGELFRLGQPLDAARYFIILPDAIGHGRSSKPSDGLRTRFPRYRYEDMVRAAHLLVRDGLKVDHLRLVIGTSMGGMQTWLWGEMYPEFMDALMPLASAPVAIAGRNRMFRAMILQAIRGDPAWKGGDYETPPAQGLMAAQYALWMMTSSPIQLHRAHPAREAADSAVEAMRKRALASDANDMLYQFEASTDYDPSPRLETIRVPLHAVNFADDEVNPPELGILEREIKRVRHGRYTLIPTSGETRGHGSHSRAVLWKQYLADLLRDSRPGQQ